MSALYWSGPIGLEGEPTNDDRVLAPGSLLWNLPVPLMPVWADEFEPPRPFGSVTDVQRHTLPDGHAVLVGFGRYVGTQYSAGDKVAVAMTTRALVHPEPAQLPPIPGAPGRQVLRDIMLLRSLVLLAVVVTERPAWPQTVIEFTHERPA